MYSYAHVIEGAKDLGFGLNQYPFTPRSYCYRRRGDKKCPTWVGRAKVMVRPELYLDVGVHGNPSGKPGSIHFNTDEAHLKEFVGIANRHFNLTVHNRTDFHTHELDTHWFKESHPRNEDGTVTVYFDRDLESWLEYVKSREVCNKLSQVQ
jgi:hypothetical protein